MRWRPPGSAIWPVPRCAPCPADGEGAQRLAAVDDVEGHRQAAFLQVGAWYWCGLFLIASLTVVAYSIGGGLAASFAPLTQSAAGMTNGAASLAGTGVGAGGKALGRGIGRGVAAGYRRMRSSSNTHAAE